MRSAKPLAMPFASAICSQVGWPFTSVQLPPPLASLLLNLEASAAVVRGDVLTTGFGSVTVGGVPPQLDVQGGGGGGIMGFVVDVPPPPSIPIARCPLGSASVSGLPPT
ncbi:MAG: hypothetical protein IVW57_16495 [Ktedonobacterales bacterium]|nr:hypothetical protein [Ktedonobacterales bacterium]